MALQAYPRPLIIFLIHYHVLFFIQCRENWQRNCIALVREKFKTTTSPYDQTYHEPFLGDLFHHHLFECLDVRDMHVNAV